MSIQQGKFKAIADKIRSILGTEDLIVPNDFADKIDDVHSMGYDTGHMEGYFQRAGEEEEFTASRKAKLDEATNIGTDNIDESIDIAAESLNDVRDVIDNHAGAIELHPIITSQNYNEILEEIIEAENNSSLNAGIEQGKQSAYDEFWDSYQNNGKRTDYERAFEGAFWTQDRFSSVKYPIRPISAGRMFRFSNITDLTVVDLYFNINTTGFFAMCREATKLVSVGDVYAAGAGNIGEIFYGCTNLTNVGKVTVHEVETYVNSFHNCSKLANITFAGTIGQNLDIRYSPLTKESITSIIEHLSSTATGKTLTLKKTAVNEAFETSEGAADGSTSAEWTALAGTKTNWTISLV